MISQRLARTKPFFLAAFALLALATVGGAALAGHLPGAVKSYTGCLVPKDGVIIKVKEGDAPAGPCTAGMTQAHLSGGDITKISVTGALTGGGDNGEVTIGLKPEFILPTGCMNGQVAKWSGTGWACAADDDTTYSAGTGLDLAGTTFSVEPDAFARTNQSCPAGQVARAVDAGGLLTCTALPSSAGVDVWTKSAPLQTGVPIAGTDLIAMPLPAGTFLVTAVATLGDLTGGDGDEEVNVSCEIRDPANSDLLGHFLNGPDIGSEADINGPRGDVMLHGVLTLAAATTIRFHCDGGGGDEAHGAKLTAVRVGTLTVMP